MVVLRTLFSALASGILRLIVAVAVLVAAYFLLLKPALQSTGDAIKSTNRKIEKSLEHGPKRVVRCVEHANGDVHRIQRCAAKF